jgi:hypothetical protein
MSEHPLKVYERIDPELLKLVEENRKFAMAGKALPIKFKLLLIMALDASNGAVQGVRANANAAIKAGATKEEVAETIAQGDYTKPFVIFIAGRSLPAPRPSWHKSYLREFFGKYPWKSISILLCHFRYYHTLNE